MARYYKQLAQCKMCKKRFVVKKKSLYWQKSYCPTCVKKFFGDKIDNVKEKKKD